MNFNGVLRLFYTLTLSPPSHSLSSVDVINAVPTQFENALNNNKDDGSNNNNDIGNKTAQQ